MLTLIPNRAGLGGVLSRTEPRKIKKFILSLSVLIGLKQYTYLKPFKRKKTLK
ncbi:hypothetical protein VCHA48P439_60069 [Vibrio chagasii]|nr:hypothetical protein VCHA48P439_60069 [Vibrio chagasii]CAH7322304.1 hypothetical protein VCHA40O236_60135 [Vibrio chagasii]CAH7468507.1 hypothetical protein VCHA53O462_60135 [Vibrio chagasii]